MLLFPAIDILDCKAVRLTQGIYGSEKIYGNPLDIAQDFSKAGVTHMHLVDLNGAKSGLTPNAKTIQEITQTFPEIFIQVGGGIRSLEVAEKFFHAGANRLIIGSAAIKNPEFLQKLLENFGPEKIVLGVDVKNITSEKPPNPLVRGNSNSFQWKNTKELKFIPYNKELVPLARELRKNPTETEKAFWEILKENNFFNLKITQQKPLLQFIADFYIASKKIVIEIDGEIHQQQKEYDIGRSEELEKYGIQVIRFSNQEIIKTPKEVVKKLQKKLQSPLTRGLGGFDYQIYTSGWTENTHISAEEYLTQTPAQNILMTDISRDGKLQGPNFEMYQNFTQQFPQKKFIGSGGVSKIQDLEKLKEIGCHSTIIGKAFYENRITLEQIKNF